jgi:Zn-dependent protease with chaperone function
VQLGHFCLSSEYINIAIKFNMSTEATAPQNESLNTERIQIKPVHVLPYRHEDPLFWISVYFAISMWLVLLIVTFGLIIPIMLLIALLGLFTHSLLITWLKGNSVKVTAQQYPDLHDLYLQTCTRLGIEKRPELYLVQVDGMLNAVATRFMRRDYVVMLSAVVDALEDRPQAIKFYMGHELGHIKRKHLSRHWWLWPGMLFPLLSPAYSRAREYTCDRHGFASCDNLDDAKRALAVLAVGPQRWKTINLAAFEEQAQATGGFWMAVNELTADYPWLCKRMMVLENRNAVFPKRNFFAWMIAALSPRMGYGGAVIGFLYWLILGVSILALTVALVFSGSNFSMSEIFKDDPVIEKLKKIFGASVDSEAETTQSADAEKPDTVVVSDQDSSNILASYGQLLVVSMAIDDYMDKNKKQIPGALSALDKDTLAGAQGIRYEVLSQSKAGTPGQVLLETNVDCENCEKAKPLMQLRLQKDGQWVCNAADIGVDIVRKLSLDCE